MNRYTLEWATGPAAAQSTDLWAGRERSTSRLVLRLSRATVYNMMNEGQLPYLKLGRSRRIPKRAVVELAASQLVGGSKRNP